MSQSRRARLSLHFGWHSGSCRGPSHADAAVLPVRHSHYRGLKDIIIACVDGLKGFPQAIETVYPKTMVQLCIVHMVRASLNYVNWIGEGLPTIRKS